ncbi:MAG: CbtB domain-containing protein [Egibacteraceae bacterium]
MTAATARLTGAELALPGVLVLLLALTILSLVAFDQGALVAPVTDAMADKGGVLHEFFHDARHLLGVPCH